MKDSTPQDGNLYNDGTVNAFLNISTTDRQKRILMKKTETIEIQIQEQDTIQAPVEKKQKLGEVTLLLNGEVLEQKNIISGDQISRKDLLWTYRQIWKTYAL